MAEPQPQFWFPQISSNTPNLHSLAVVKAVNQVVELFTSESTSFHQISICDECKNQGILSSSSLEAKVVLKGIVEFLKPEAKPPFYVLGNVTKNEAVVQSWNDLGLNLFDLPWGRLPKIFRYIPVLSLPDMLKALSDGISNYNNAIEYAKYHVRWAQCHEWIREIQRCFSHGNRDKMQLYGVEEAINNIQRVKDAVPKTLPCSECHVKNVLENAYYHIPTESEFQQLLRRVANTDCQSCRLAPLSSIPLNMKSRYKRVVILEDDPDMRKHLAKKIGERYGIDSVQKANVDKSQKKWCFCGDGDTAIKVKDESCNEWETLVCFDLELDQKEKTHDKPDGLWFLYNTALHHPFVSRLVIPELNPQLCWGEWQKLCCSI